MSRPGNPANRNRTATGVRFQADTLARLHAAADERDLSVNFLVNRAVEQFLRDLLPVEEIVWTRQTKQGAKRE